MIRRRSLRIALGVLLVLAGMGGVARYGWQFRSRHSEYVDWTWVNVAVVAVCAIVLYLGVHLIFGSPAKRVESDAWDSNSLD